MVVRMSDRIALVSVLAAGCLAGAAAAQTTDKAEAAGWDSTVAAGYNLTDGNSSTELLKLSATTEKKVDKNETRLGAEYSYGESDSEKTEDTGKATAKYNRLFTERDYAYGAAEALFDKIADIDYRITVGPGLGHYFIKDETKGLSVEAGPSFVTEEVGGETDDYLALRIAERLDWKLTDASKVWESAEYLPDAANFDKYYVNAEVGAEAALNAKLSLRLVAQDKYNSEPAPEKKSNDVSLTSSLVWKF